MLIALEGIDGSGHTTQAHALAKALEASGRRVYVTAQPSLGSIGKEIRTFLQGQVEQHQYFPETLALLFAADRLHHYGTEIQPKLNEGFDVICDRYLLSSWVYQSLQISEDWIRRINQFAPLPKLTLLIDTSVAEARSRREKRGSIEEIFEVDHLQHTIRDRYLELAPSIDAIVVNGCGTQEEVTQRLLQETLKHQ
ncbi:MAG: dTMP kinase [Myxococcaceae bacterium]|nr:dTMP kinase [Myxococcaceae bacterium]MBH2006542.1 dTMP kinase [Myxococcaceae bacterium]